MSRSHQSSQSCLPRACFDLIWCSFKHEWLGSARKLHEGTLSCLWRGVIPGPQTKFLWRYSCHGCLFPWKLRDQLPGGEDSEQGTLDASAILHSRGQMCKVHFCLMKAEPPSHMRSWGGSVIFQHHFTSSWISHSLSALLCRQDLLLFQVDASLSLQAPREGLVKVVPSFLALSGLELAAG